MGEQSGDPPSTRLVYRDATARDAPGSATDEPGAHEADAVPERIGRYVVTELLGRGGMGVVYAAHDPTLTRNVAIKLVRASRLASDAGARARLVREAQSIARLAHPNVVEVYEIGKHGDEVFVAMELVDGASLRRWREVARRSHAELMEVLRQAGEGLAAAHRAGIVHRDFKPDNIMVSVDGRVRVLDFGLARPGESVQSADAARISTVGDDRLTQTGTTMGTPAYMAPEQFVGGEVDGRTDQFAFCVVAIEALSGRRPFAGTGMDALAVLVANQRIDPAALRAIPHGLVSVLRRGLSPRREDRWPDMPSLLAAMRGRALAPWIAAGIGTAALATTLLFAVDRDRCVEDTSLRDTQWNDTGRERVRAAILATAVPHAESIWGRVGAVLDDRVERWTRASATTCLAGRDAELACLDQRRVELTAAIEALGATDRATVHNAERLVAALRTADDCGSAPAAAVSPEHAHARDRLAAATALATLGLYPAALAELDAAPALDDAADPEAIAAQIHHRRGEIDREIGDGLGAAAAFERAYFAALAAKRDDLAARAASELAAEGAVAYRDRWQWAAHAKASFGRLGSDASAIEYDRAMCTLQRDSGALPEAIEHCTRALAAAEKEGATIEDRLAALHASADVHLAADDVDAALALYTRALVLAESQLGAEHPRVADALEDLGFAELRERDTISARRHGERALEIREGLGDADDVRLARSWSLIAAVDHDEKAFASARTGFERALALRRKHLGDGHRDVARSLYSLSLAREELGEREPALATMAQAAAIEEQLHPLDISRLPTLRELARMAFMFGAGPTAGREHLERAWEIVKRSGVPLTHPLVKDLDHGYGETLLALDRYADALPYLERFVADPRPSPIGPHVEFVLGRTLWKAHRERERAVAIVERARTTWASPTNEFQRTQIADMATWLASTPEQRQAWDELAIRAAPQQ